MNGYHIFSLKNESAMYKRLADFFFQNDIQSCTFLSKFEKKFLRPDYLQIQFVKKNIYFIIKY